MNTKPRIIIKEHDMYIEPITFQPTLRIRADISWSMEAAQNAELSKGSILDDISVYELGKTLIDTIQEQPKEKHMNEGN